MRIDKTISWLTALLVVFLTGSAFVLSYNNLQALAEENAIIGWLSFLWPLTLDAFMIAAGLSALRGSLNRDTFGRLWYPWLLVGLFTVLSIAFNILHAPETLLAQSIAAMPPLVVFLALELFASQVAQTTTGVDGEKEQPAVPVAQKETKLPKAQAIPILRDLIGKTGVVDRTKFAEEAGVKPQTVSSWLKYMVQEGMILSVSGNGRYELVEEMEIPDFG